MARRGTPLPDALVQQIQKQLAEKIPHRKISKSLQVSRTTVCAIAQNKRKIIRCLSDDDSNDYPIRLEIYPPQRCPGCRAMLNVLPCLYCQMTGNLKGLMLRDAYPYRILPEERENLYSKSA